MSQSVINDSTLTAIADAINAKAGTTGKMLPSAMPEKIAAIPTGGDWDVSVETKRVLATSYDYVHRGLILMLDGIDNSYDQNTDTRYHDDATTTWCNLATGRSLTLTTSSEVRAKSIYGKPRTYEDTTSAQGGLTTSFPDVNQYRHCEFVTKLEGNSDVVIFCQGIHNRVAHVRRSQKLIGFNGYSASEGKARSVNISNLNDDLILSVGFEADTSPSSARLNGEEQSPEVGLVGASGTFNNYWLGRGFWSNSVNAMPLVGELYAIRFYDRKLTPKETLENYIVDMARFFGDGYVSKIVTTATNKITGEVLTWEKLVNTL